MGKSGEQGGREENLFRDAKNKVLSWSWSDNKDGVGEVV